MSQKLADTGVEALKASPAVAVVAAAAQGLTLQDWVLIATLVYLTLQAGWLVWKWIRAARTTGWSPRDD